jgi:hypothetical protein
MVVIYKTDKLTIMPYKYSKSNKIWIFKIIIYKKLFHTFLINNKP